MQSLEEYLLDKMAEINKLKRIESIKWDYVDGYSEWCGFEHKVNHRAAVTVTDNDGYQVTIPLHAFDGVSEMEMHSLDHVLVGVLVWLIHMQLLQDSTIPMGCIADMVNPCRAFMESIGLDGGYDHAEK